METLEELIDEVNDTTENPVVEIPTSESRFAGAAWYKNIKTFNFLLGGCGGINSHVAFQLSRLHPQRINIYDDDIVEEHNLAGQFFTFDGIDCYKANHIQRLLKKFSHYYSTYTLIEKITANTYVSNLFWNTNINKVVFVGGFDNMKARKDFYELWRHSSSPLLIDGRLSIDTLQVYVVQNKTECKKEYEKTLFDDSEADRTICNLKQTTFMASMIASFIINVITNYVANIDIEDDDLKNEIPFSIEYDCNTMFCKITD